MKQVTKPVPPGDALDALLGGFFKAEMPAEWPAFRAPAASTRRLRFPPERSAARPSGRRGAMWSRLALAASVALLVLAAWLMPGPTSGPAGRGLPTIGPGSATHSIDQTPPPPAHDKDVFPPGMPVIGEEMK